MKLYFRKIISNQIIPSFRRFEIFFELSQCRPPPGRGFFLAFFLYILFYYFIYHDCSFDHPGIKLHGAARWDKRGREQVVAWRGRRETGGFFLEGDRERQMGASNQEEEGGGDECLRKRSKIRKGHPSMGMVDF